MLPASLRHAAQTVVASSVPMALWWSGEWLQLVNVALIAAAGSPSIAAGRPAKESWPDGWEVLGPGVRAAAAESAPVVLHDVPVPRADGGSAHWSVQLGHVVDEGGRAAGVIGTVLDRTEQVLAQARERQSADETNTNLQAALASNRRIGTAVGILMVQRRITDSAAFDLLRLASQRTHRKLREIAEEVVHTGALSGD
ncbi:MAG TPA: ANTAR domain-containing protein [Jatrophihabitantaceae bacterium]